MDDQERINELKAKWVFNFTDSLDQVAEEILRLIDEKFEANQADDTGNKIASLNVPVKFQVKKLDDGVYSGVIKVLPKDIQTFSGVSEFEVDFNQPDLPMNGNQEQKNKDNSEQVEQQEQANTDKKAAPAAKKRGRPAKMQTGTAPDINEFSYHVTESGEISNADLDKYFSGSSRWKNYAGWIAAGNGDVARKILTDEAEMKSFIELVKASLQADAPAA